MAAESPAKKARTEDAETYYQVIDGEKYDKKLLEEAEAFAKDGQISYPEAKKLVESAQDGKGITDIEKATLKYAMEKLQCSTKAKNFLEVTLKDPSSSYYEQIDGKKYDRSLLDSAKAKAADGQISFQEAKDLLESAKDGKGITPTERATLEYTLANLKYTDKARKFLTEELGSDKKGSYYVKVDGVQYDRELLEKAQGFVKDGQISDAEAKQLFEDAKDGPGITGCERRTLEHTLKSMKYTDKAKEWMTAALAGPVN